MSVKIQDGRLGHTISRDDVRRDESFHHAVAVAKQVVAQTVNAASVAVMHAAEAHDLERHRALMVAIASAGLALGHEHIYFPIVEPIGGNRHCWRGRFRTDPCGPA